MDENPYKAPGEEGRKRHSAELDVWPAMLVWLFIVAATATCVWFLHVLDAA